MVMNEKFCTINDKHFVLTSINLILPILWQNKSAKDAGVYLTLAEVTG